ncbi:MAG: TonB-dependent receptor [Ignavibacteriaceae bacterium]|jgi:outer membrane receptor protein involved in Fe transport|nr:TonB-dependent receptor [Ignavibacteriaceae bacterium]
MMVRYVLSFKSYKSRLLSHSEITVGVKIFRPSIFLCTLLFVFSYSIYAQEKKIDPFDLSLEELGKLVVTSSKKARPASNVTQKVDVIAQNELEKLTTPHRNLAELIQYLPSSNVMVLSRNDANWGAYGGIGPKYNTFMVNGLVIDGFVDPMSLDKSPFSRIEVQRGPASVLYPNYLSQDFAGNQSPLAGTINFIPKDIILAPLSSIDLMYGKYNTYSVHAYHENSFQSISFFGGFNYEQSDYTNYGSENSWLDMTKNPDYKKTKLFLGSTLFLDKQMDHKISLFANQTFHTGDFGRANRKYENAYSLLNLAYTGEITNRITLNIKTGLRLYDRRYENDNYSPQAQDLSLNSTDVIKQTIIPVDLSFSYLHLSGSNLTIGGDFQNALFSTLNQPVNLSEMTMNDATAKNVGIYAQEELMLDRFTLRSGVRYNYVNYDVKKVSGSIPGQSTKSWNSFLWSAGIKYRVTDSWDCFVNSGNSFMPPSLKSASGTIKASDLNVPGVNGQLPNPDLKPESGFTLDLGTDLLLQSNLSFSARFFYSRMTDAIMEIVISKNPSQTMSVNAGGKTIAKGLELAMKHSLGGHFSWFANFTLIDSKIYNPVLSDEDNLEVPFVSPFTVNTGFSAILPYATELYAWLKYSDKIYDSNSRLNRISYKSGETINLRIQKNINLYNGVKSSIYLIINNITDNKYDMPWQFRDTGFQYFVGLNTSF